MDGVLLDLRQKRPSQDNVKKEASIADTSFKVSRSLWPPSLQFPIAQHGSHTQKMPLKCPDCGKSFSHSSSLKRHSRTHSGVRPFICSICSKGFHYKNNLQDHARTHTGEKPFKCPDCGQSFAQSSTLNRHIGTHGKDKTCHICGKAFVKLSLLQKHFSSHTSKEESTPFGHEESLLCTREVNLKDSGRILHVHDPEEDELSENHSLCCLKCGMKFEELLDFQQHLWCHVGEGQNLFYGLAALNGLLNMCDHMKQDITRSD